MPRIAVGGVHHETNTFAANPATYEDFVVAGGWPGLTRGEAIFDVFPGINIGLAGFMAEAGRAGWALVPLLWTQAGPSGRVTADAYERIVSMLVADLAAAMPVDAVYLCLHGAMVTDAHEDGEGELLRRVRAVVARDVPIVISLDLHANVTEAMVAHADLLTGYRTYPHVDMAETGRRAQSLLARVMAGDLGGKALRKADFLIPLTAQCTMAEPGRGLYARLAEIERETGASLSFTPGFPPADIRECGPAIVAYARDQATADRAADLLAAALAEAETRFGEPILEPADAVATAGRLAGNSRRPVVLADTQDNPGAGGASDTTGLLRALVEGKAEGAILAILHDPEAAAAAHAAGVGAEIDLALGGRSDGVPYRARYRVKALGDGRFAGSGPMWEGASMQLGLMARLETAGVEVIVGSIRQQPSTQAIFRHLGVEPTERRILVLKSSVHFRADFQDLAAAVLVVAAPGANLADSAAFDFRHLRPDVRRRPRAG